MSAQCEISVKQNIGAKIGFFERYLTLWVFVWSNLSGGEPHFTLTQVALNDTKGWYESALAAPGGEG